MLPLLGIILCFVTSILIAEIVVKIISFLIALLLIWLQWLNYIGVFSWKLGLFFEKKAASSEKSVLEVKKDIIEELTTRNTKLLIVIDDIDRLNQNEIHEIFKLVRINWDFPNTIYLLSFDREIVEKNLQQQPWINWKDYLDKIIQVTFDVPHAKANKIEKFLFSELDRVIALLPKRANDFFTEEDDYWSHIYKSWVNSYFQNIRDVKRFISSLEFNLKQIHRQNVLEVNPIDFIAIEAIRIFAPSFFDFIRKNKDIFTLTKDELWFIEDNDGKKKLLEEVLGLTGKYQNETKELVRALFPQVNSVFESNGYHGADWQKTWFKELRVCSNKNFDSYFTWIPWWDEDGLSQFEIDTIFKTVKQWQNKLEKILKRFIENNKIKQVLQVMQEGITKKEWFSQNEIENVILSLFNVADDLPIQGDWLIEVGNDMEMVRVIYQIFKSEKDKKINYNILKKVIPRSKWFFWPMYEVALEERKDNKSGDSQIPSENLTTLEQLALKKIIKHQWKILDHDMCIRTLYLWKSWDHSKKFEIFIEGIIKNEVSLLKLLNKFIGKSSVHTMGRRWSKIKKHFNYKTLENFVDLDKIKKIISSMKAKKKSLYKKNQEMIDLFLKDFDKKDQEDLA